MGRRITGVHTWGRYDADGKPLQLGSNVSTIKEVLRKVHQGAGLWHTYQHEDNGHTTLYYNAVKRCWLVVVSEQYAGSAALVAALQEQARQRNAHILVDMIREYTRRVDNALQLLFDRDCGWLPTDPWRMTASGLMCGYQSVKRDTLVYGVDSRGAYIKRHTHSGRSTRCHNCSTYRPRNYADAIANVRDYIALDTMPEVVNHEP